MTPEALERHSTLVTHAKSIRDLAAAEGRDLTDAELAAIELDLAEANKLSAQFPPPRPGMKSDLEGPDHWANVKGGYQQPTDRLPRVAKGPKYSQMFGDGPLSNDSFPTFGHWLQAVDAGVFHPKLAAASGMRSDLNSDGGYLVPTQYASMMLDAALEDEIVRPRAMVHPMSGDTLKISGLNNLTHSSHLFGGLIAYWTKQGSAPTDTYPKVRQIDLQAKKLFCLSAATNELVSDASDFENLLGAGMIGAVSWFLDLAFLTGTGAGEPLGVLHDNALITVDKVSGQDASTVWYRNLVNMFARLHPACYRKAVWVANPTVIPQLLQLDTHADLGSGSALVGDSLYSPFRESNGKFSLFGREVLFSEKLPALGTTGDILLADFSQYSIGLRKEIAVERSGHAGFKEDETWYRCILRADGMGRWSSAVTPKNGDSLSWCVALQTRG